MKSKSIYILMFIAIIAGIVLFKAKGFNYSTTYGNHERLEVSLKQTYNLKDIEKIAKESFKGKVAVIPTATFRTQVAVDCKEMSDAEITTYFNKLNEKYNTTFNIKDIKKDKIVEELNVTDLSTKTDEEINALIAQIKEKYNLEYTKEELLQTSSAARISTVHRVPVYDMLRTMVTPLILSLVLSAIYFAIRYYKLSKLSALIFALKMILIEGFVLSVIVIARIPVSGYIPALVLTVWLVGILGLTFQNERELKELKTEK